LTGAVVEVEVGPHPYAGVAIGMDVGQQPGGGTIGTASIRRRLANHDRFVETGFVPIVEERRIAPEALIAIHPAIVMDLIEIEVTLRIVNGQSRIAPEIPARTRRPGAIPFH